MNKIDRRSALGIGLTAASAAMLKPAASQTTGYKDTTPWPGVVVRAYDGETPSIIPGFKTVSMRDVIMQPGSKTMGGPTVVAVGVGSFSAIENFCRAADCPLPEDFPGKFAPGEAHLLAPSHGRVDMIPASKPKERQKRCSQIRRRRTRRGPEFLFSCT
jgi:hypothetical protein